MDDNNIVTKNINVDNNLVNKTIGVDKKYNDNINTLNMIEHNKLDNKMRTNIIVENIDINTTSTFDKKTIKNIPHINSINNKKVINISSYELKKEETKVLNKDLNFSLAPKWILNEEIICSLEDGIKAFNDEDKELVRQECVVILRKARPPKINLNHEQLSPKKCEE